MAETKKKTSRRKTAAPTAATGPKITKQTQYEAMFLLGPAGATEPAAAEATCRKFIEAHGGQIAVLKKWDERKLAYEINKNKRGTYILSLFTAPSTAIGPIERDVKLSEDVLRVMVTNADHLNEKEMNAVEPQPIQPREERNPWDRPDFNRPPRRDDRGPRDGDRPRDDRGPRREENADMGAKD